MLHRLTELTIKSANGTNTPEVRQAIQDEIGQIIEEINSISDRATFNTIKIFDTGVKDIINGGTTGTGSTNVNTWMAGIDSVSVSGTPLDYSESNYIFSADKDSGISINGTLYDWNSIKSSSGKSINELESGIYTITHNGVTFSLNLLDKSTLEDVAKSMNGVKATTTNAHESRSWSTTNTYRMFINNDKTWDYSDRSGHSLNFSSNAISIDGDSAHAYVLNNSDWNDILGINDGAENATHSEYDIK